MEWALHTVGAKKAAGWLFATVASASRADQNVLQKLYSKFGARGLIRGATLGLCAANLVGGGLAYAFGKRKDEEE